MANAAVLTMRKRYVFPGWKGRVAFSLNPTAPVSQVGFEPTIGPRYVEFCAKYINPESERICCFSKEADAKDWRLTWDGLDTIRIRSADELLQQDGMFFVIPVPENNGEFFVILCDFFFRVNYQRCSQTVDVLAL